MWRLMDEKIFEMRKERSILFTTDEAMEKCVCSIKCGYCDNTRRSDILQAADEHL